MGRCPEIKTCALMRSKEDFEFFCLTKPEECRLHLVRKRPSDWFKEKDKKVEP